VPLMPVYENYFSCQHAPREELAPQTHDLLLEAETADPARHRQILNEVITSHLWFAVTLARRSLHRQGSFVGFAMPTIAGMLKRHFRDYGTGYGVRSSERANSRNGGRSRMAARRGRCRCRW
jgi:hypothetical protein